MFSLVHSPQSNKTFPQAFANLFSFRSDNEKDPDSSRYEVKMVIPFIWHDFVERILRTHPALFAVTYPTRQVNTLYLDTYEFALYRANLWGLSSRAKVRYRWYGSSLHPSEGQFEIKHKRNRTNWKRVFKVPQINNYAGRTWRAILGNILKELPLEGRAWIYEYPLPILITRYQRQYFLSKDRTIRITVDSQQQSFDQRYKPLPNVSHPTNQPQTIVLEIKGESRYYKEISDLFSDLPFRVGRHSKYVTGLKNLQGF